jgi:hypothetical protein
MVLPAGAPATAAEIVGYLTPGLQVPTITVAACAACPNKHAINPTATIVIVRSSVFVLIKVSSIDFRSFRLGGARV